MPNKQQSEAKTWKDDSLQTINNNFFQSPTQKKKKKSKFKKR